MKIFLPKDLQPVPPIEKSCLYYRQKLPHWELIAFFIAIRAAMLAYSTLLTVFAAKNIAWISNINLLTPWRSQVSPFTEISILFKEGIINKISYESRAYESVDEERLF